jgi:hypothetical protein
MWFGLLGAFANKLNGFHGDVQLNLVAGELTEALDAVLERVEHSNTCRE